MNEFNKHKKSDAVKWVVVFVAIILLAVSVAAAITRGFTTANPWGWLDKPDTEQTVKPDDTNKPDEPEEPAVNWADVYTFESQFENGVQHLSITGFVASPNMARANIVIPAKIGEAFVGVTANAFAGNSVIETVIIEDGVEFIGDGAFNYIPNLKTVEIRGELGMLGSSIFASNSNLVNVKLSESLTHLGSGMFTGCSSLRKIIIPSTCKNVNSNIFDYCGSELTVYMRSGATFENFDGDTLPHGAHIVRNYTGD